MLLNLLQVEGIEPEELMRRSYRQFQTERRLPGMKKKLEELQVGEKVCEPRCIIDHVQNV